jgi:hypothetical protein
MGPICILLTGLAGVAVAFCAPVLGALVGAILLQSPSSFAVLLKALLLLAGNRCKLLGRIVKGRPAGCRLLCLCIDLGDIQSGHGNLLPLGSKKGVSLFFSKIGANFLAR